MRNCLQMLSCKQDVKKGGAGSALGYKQAVLWDGSWLGLLIAPKPPLLGQGWQARALAGLGPSPRVVSTKGLGFNKQKH